MENLVYLLASPRGRFLRILIGLLTVWIGTYVVPDPLVHWVQAIGAIPILTGVFNVCLFAPMIQEPVRGSQLS